ncbi:hypothetical protein BST81_13775 [Leptolyngbya sp. 'hensonii']|nr:hypothetical protein BST81_13775 [Leptolyngbya sp. 'hensonii']
MQAVSLAIKCEAIRDIVEKAKADGKVSTEEWICICIAATQTVLGIFGEQIPSEVVSDIQGIGKALNDIGDLNAEGLNQTVKSLQEVTWKES